MRSLLYLQWCLLLLLVGCALATEDCDWKMPVAHPLCEQKIKWKVHDTKQALATCLEHFPTTFMKAEFTATEITCTVYRQFQCNHEPGSLLMFDRCYKFFPAVGEKTLTEYLTPASGNSYCAGGALPVLLTMTQAKHVAMRAHQEGIFKFWANVDKNGKTIEARQGASSTMQKGFMLYKDQWKVNEAYHWVGTKLEVTPKDAENKPTKPVDYLFFRSKTDHWNNLIQGSFERASADSEAGIVCEYEAKIVPDQRFYCAKMKALSLNAEYDNSRGRQRCVYTTLTHYPLMGTESAIKDFKGCGEKPSAEHSSGLDDGTADAAVYKTLTLDNTQAKGSYRVAAIKVSTVIATNSASFASAVRKHCDKKSYSGDDLRKQRQPYEIFDHFMRKDYAAKMQSGWEDNYPKDECSDFPSADMHSNTLAIRNGKRIDVPTPVLIPVICSIASNVDCSNRPKKDVCPRDDQFCHDVLEWQHATGLYAECRCPKFHRDVGNVCTWTEQFDACGKTKTYGTTTWNFFRESPYWNYYDTYQNTQSEAIVRNGCKLTIYAHKIDNMPESQNVAILGPVTVGQYDIPNDKADTLRGWDGQMSASAVTCKCDNPK